MDDARKHITAKLIGADLTGAKLNGTKLAGAEIDHANFTNAKGLSAALGLAETKGREFAIFDGNPPPETLEDFDDSETPADEAAPAEEPPQEEPKPQ